MRHWGQKTKGLQEDRKFHLKCSPFFHWVREINDTICTMKLWAVAEKRCIIIFPLWRGGLIRKPYASLAGTRCSPHLLPGGLTQITATVTASPITHTSLLPKSHNLRLRWEHGQVNSRGTAPNTKRVVITATLDTFVFNKLRNKVAVTNPIFS